MHHPEIMFHTLVLKMQQTTLSSIIQEKNTGILIYSFFIFWLLLQQYTTIITQW